MSIDAAPRKAAELGHGDDLALPFRAEASRVNGHLVRLGPGLDEILTRHNYPHAVCKVLGEAIVLGALLGSALKSGTRLTLQTQSDGPIGFLVVDYQAPGNLRAYASYNDDGVTSAVAAADQGSPHGERSIVLLGKGRLAMTIDPGPGLQQYQGLVALGGDNLRDIALTYFRQSAQLPTFLSLAVAQHYSGESNSWSWRGGGLMVQNTAKGGGFANDTDHDPDEELPMLGEDEEGWRRTRILAETVEDHELLDPLLRPEDLLYRLFHEEGVRAFEAKPLVAQCTCSRERVALILGGFSSADVEDMRTEDGGVRVTCQFCSRDYRFDLDEITERKAP